MRVTDREWRAHPLHRSRSARSFAEHMKGVAVTRHDLLRLRHFFPEGWIVSSETVAAVRPLDQKQRLSIARLKAADNLLRQHNTERVAKLPDFEGKHCPKLLRYYYCNNTRFQKKGAHLRAARFNWRPLHARACLCILVRIYARAIMLTDRQQIDRRNAILRILRGGVVRRQSDLAQLLKRDGFQVTQSSVSRDLRELGVLKASGRYLVPPDEISRANGDFGALSRFVRTVRTAGASITVIRTTIGAAPSVAVALDKAEWPEVVGTISGDDTIFLATADARAQQRLIERLNLLFRT